VTRDLPPNVLAAGMPARVIRSLSSGEQAGAQASTLASIGPR
jgi:acetyltransferase-like isoleucine patch superfamily enzyme